LRKVEDGNRGEGFYMGWKIDSFVKKMIQKGENDVENGDTRKC
jgi:hypothetical protein